jgi:hypothetical protein
MKPTNARILNRDGTIPADHWYQIEVKGTWPAGSFADGKPRKQLIDDQALQAILNRFQEDRATAGEDFPGILVDVDHLSHELDQKTEAYAWLQDVQIRNGDLYGRLDLTDLGEPAIKNKRLKFFSTEYDPEHCEPAGDGIVRPLRLAGLAFTNRPNNRGGKPISNRTGTEPGGEPKPDDTTKPMKPIAESLGLSADADEAAILAAITQLKSEVATAKTKDNEREADAIMNSLGKRIPEAARPHWREQLITNREAAKKSIELSFPEGSAPSGEKRIFNRDGAKSPDPVGGEGDDQKTSKRRELVNTIRNRDRCSHTDAWNAARSQAPELFN